MARTTSRGERLARATDFFMNRDLPLIPIVRPLSAGRRRMRSIVVSSVTKLNSLLNYIPCRGQGAARQSSSGVGCRRAGVQAGERHAPSAGLVRTGPPVLP